MKLPPATHHRLKHDGGWIVCAPDPYTYTWTSRLGHDYTVEIPKIIDDLPDPDPTIPAPLEWQICQDPDRDYFGDPWQQSDSWRTRPEAPEPPPEPEPPPKLPPELDIPPF